MIEEKILYIHNLIHPTTIKLSIGKLMLMPIYLLHLLFCVKWKLKKKYSNYKFEYEEIKVFYFPFIYLFLINISAISTAFKAAPLRRLSETIHKLIVLS